MDLLRLAGAPGVGKSTTAWAIAQRLAADGVATGYVDTDQLGMCYPAPDSDPDRWALKERALAGIADEFQRAGVVRMVVSGVAWPDDPPPQLDRVSVRSIWLDASEEIRRQRLGVRSLGEEQLAQFLSAGTAEAERVNSVWERLDTDDRSEAETVEDVLARWPSTAAPLTQVTVAPSPGPSSGPVLWVTGPRLAGASRIGWEVVSREWAAGRRTGFVDLAQLSFTWNIGDSVGLANLARLQEVFSEAGADLLVVVAPLEIDPAEVRAALPASELSFARLTASADDLREHAGFRQRGGGPVLAGDDIRGASDAAIDDVIRISNVQSTRPLREHEVALDTQGLSLADAATVVRRAAG